MWRLLPMLLLALVAGCGGSDSKPPLTKAQFIARGDRLCNDFRKAEPATVPGGSWQAVHEGSLAAARAEARFADNFAALDAPADGRSVQQHVVATELRVAGITRKIADLAATPSRSSHDGIVEFVRQLRSEGESLRGELRRYGFKVCGLPRST
jgi:hypothetical protein